MPRTSSRCTLGRSRNCKYDVLKHPSFHDYACGTMASEFQGLDSMKKNPELLKRFPPRHLDGLGPGLYWLPPKQHAEEMESYRRSKAWAASYAAGQDDLRNQIDERQNQCCHSSKSDTRSGGKDCRPSWRSLAAAVGTCAWQNRFRWAGTCDKSKNSGFARNSPAQPESARLSARGKTDGGVGLDRSASARPDRPGLQRAGSRLLSRRSKLAAPS